MYAVDNLADRRIEQRRSVMSGRALSRESYRSSDNQYERAISAEELYRMLKPKPVRIEYPKKEEEGNYAWKNAAPVPAEKFFAAMYNPRNN